MLQVIALAQYSLAYTRRGAAKSSNDRLRLAAKIEQFEQEVALMLEEIRIKDLRMAGILASRRPHYQPSERYAILLVRAARGWTLERTAPYVS